VATPDEFNDEDTIRRALRLVNAETELLGQRCAELLAGTIENQEQLQAVVGRARLADEWIQRFLFEQLTDGRSPLIGDADADADADFIISMMRDASALTPELEASIASLRKDLNTRTHRLAAQLLVFGRGDQYGGLIALIGMVDFNASTQPDTEAALNDPGHRAELFRRFISPAGWQLIANYDRDAFVMAIEGSGESSFIQKMVQAIEEHYRVRGREIWPNYGG